MTVIPGVESQKTTATATKAHTLTLPWVTAATARFIYTDRLREVVSLALVSGKNFLFSGPGGHGKSEFIEAVFSVIKGIGTPYVKSLGQGTTPEELFGGIDFKKFDAERTMHFDFERSFMNHELATFEEMFDAPARVLTALKDVLTSLELRNGDQREEIKTKVLAAATNMSPADLAAADRSVAALIERFPLQWEVKWPSYTEDDFLKMLNVDSSGSKPSVQWTEIEEMQEQVKTVEVSDAVQRMWAYMLAELRKDKVIISPRTAMMAMQLIKAAAVINGRSKAVLDDVRVVAFLPGCQNLYDEIFKMIEEKRAEFLAEEIISDAQIEIGLVKGMIEEAVTLPELEACEQELQSLQNRLSSVKVGPDSKLTETYRSLELECADLVYSIEEKITPLRQMEELTRSGERITEIARLRSDLQNRIKKCKNRAAAEMIKDEVSDLLDELRNYKKSSNSMVANRAHGVIENMGTLLSFADERVRHFKNSNNGWGK